MEEAHPGELTRSWIIAMLAIIGTGGLLARLAHMPADIPVTFDSMLYFWYANDVALLGALPVDYTPINNGWPIFLSFFFRLVDSASYLDYMLVQRLVGAALSVLTAVPVYLICRRFFPARYALAGPVIFVFEPRIVENSFAGLTEPLFVLLVATTVACFLSENKRVVFLAFPVAALATMVRGEGIILVVPYAILYIVRFRRLRRTAYEAPLLVLLFVLVLVPMSAYRLGVTDSDGMFVRAFTTVDKSLATISIAGPPTGGNEQARPSGQEDRLGTVTSKIINAGISSVPVIIFLAPYGFYRMFRNMEMKNVSVLVVLFFMAIPAVYTLVIIAGSRYLFLMVPILCVFCVFSVKRLSELFPSRNVALAAIVGIVVTSSVIIMETNRIDTVHEAEAVQIAAIVIEKTEKTNHYGLESGYIPSAVLDRLGEFPILRSDTDEEGGSIRHCVRVEIQECDSIRIPRGDLEEFLSPGSESITHLVVDDKTHRRPQFMIDIFQNEQEYPFLDKIYDSKDDGFEYHVKIFEIDHEEFNVGRFGNN